MKQAFRLSCAVIALFLLSIGAARSTQAQTTPDPFVTQLTTSTGNTYAGDISGNGRLVVVESTGDISTEKTTARNNADGNREIFLIDYAQRRIFQITNTKSARVNTANPALSTTNASDFSNVRVEVSNNHPTISNNGRWIVFSSNAVLTTASQGTFDGDANSAALQADGNQEIYVYFIPATATVNLALGVDPGPVDLTTGEFTQITNTAASRLPQAGTATSAPQVAFDNRDASQSDNMAFIAFVSTRSLVAGGNADANPEIFIYRRVTASPLTGTITQMTNTTGQFDFNENPSISGSGAAVAFISNANISAGGATNNADANGEVYLGSVDLGTGAATVTRQVTRTTNPTTLGPGTNFFSPGRRISRDGNLIAFESIADLSGNGATGSVSTVFIYNVASSTFTQVGPRGQNTSGLRFPTFTDYNVSLQPATIIFTSFLNFRADGTIPTTATDGLNPLGAAQIFSAPVAAPTTFTKLTNTPGGPASTIQPFASNTRDRITFTMIATELGGLNTDLGAEAFYLISRQGTDAAGATLSFFTGASIRPVVSSPTDPAVATLAPGMLAIVRSTTALAPSGQVATSASESTRRPALPVELNGVTVSINSAAAGLVFVSTGEIQFVVPPGLAPTTGTATYPVVINNNGTTIRSTIQISIAQPDIFTVTTPLGTGRASVLNVTNPLLVTGTPEPFTVTTTYVNSSGATVTEATKLRIFLTGVRRITDKSQITVTIGTTALTGAAVVAVAPTDTPGTDQIDVTLPASLAGAGDVPVIVSVTNSGSTFTSRSAATAPRIRIQ